MNFKIEHEYQSFTEVLHEYNIPYCMDSGVLLALMREGRIFDHEKDIDLQMWSEYEVQFIGIIPLLKEYGWHITIWKYKGLIYQFRIQRRNKIPIHIMMFRKHMDWAWCPAGSAKSNLYSSYLGKRFYSLFSKARKLTRNYLVVTDVALWPWKVGRNLGTWWVPSYFFEEPWFNEQFNVYMPREWRKYLEFRYGNWKIPKNNWDFWYDDGALNHRAPEELVNL